ncbi:hypothetical protein L7F22_061806 [Adiantum nelumboides]|nr:hypothetical protein [Adiantum nelumboides]MCO5607609.1 hypothetical protein [Adiantum nelumboides]
MRMNTRALLLLACLFIGSCTGALAHDDDDGKKPSLKKCRKRAASLCGPSSFTFYFHNTVYNPAVDNTDYFTSVYGLPPNVTWPNPYAFGTTSTFEVPLTSGPSNSSQRLGQANGFWQLNSKMGYMLFHVFTANITEGDYKGTIDIFGQLREIDPVRYLTVIGGTGDFLAARGLAACRLVSIDRTPPAKWTLSFDLYLYY